MGNERPLVVWRVADSLLRRKTVHKKGCFNNSIVKLSSETIDHIYSNGQHSVAVRMSNFQLDPNHLTPLIVQSSPLFFFYIFYISQHLIKVTLYSMVKDRDLSNQNIACHNRSGTKDHECTNVQ